MLVTHVLGDCPGCGCKDSFGNVAVEGDHIFRGCKRCKFQSTEWLPNIRKKVLYLDQCFLSGAFRAVDTRFLEAAAHVKRIAQLQLLLVPYSSIHLDETHQWRGYKDFKSEDLLAFIKATARGAEFEKDYQVERTQITKAWKAFLKGIPANYVSADDDAIDGPLNKWDGYYRVEVDGYFKDVDLKRSLKRKSVEALINAFDEWQYATTTFDEDVDIETRAAAKNYLDSYLKMLSRLAEGDYAARFDSPIAATVLERLLQHLPRLQPLDEKLKRCVEYFNSEHFKQVPKVWIEARMFATLKDMVKRGAYSKRSEASRRLNGIFEDINHISLYAPYCDAFFMDQPMADLVRQPSLDLERRYGVKVFSLNNMNEFMDWLDGVENEMSDEHRAGLKAAYPGLPYTL